MKDSDKNPKDGKHSFHVGKKNSLGISPAIYGLGVSFKDALVWGAAVTVAMIGVLGFGHKGPNVKKAVSFIEDAHAAIKDFSKSSMKWVADKLGIKNGSKAAGPLFHITPATVAASAGVGWFASHLAQVPGLRTGYKHAQGAIDKHNTVVAENEQLVHVNAELAKENDAYRVEIAKRDASFTEQLAKQSAPEASVGQGR